MKSPLGAQTVLGDRHDPICEILFANPVGGPAELARENFPTAGHASCSAKETASESSQGIISRNRATAGDDDRRLSEFDLQERSFACDSSIDRSLYQ